MGPLSIFCRVGKNNRNIECSCNIRGPKYPLTAINREVYGSKMGVSSGCHSLIKIDDHTGVENLAWSHERLQGVPMDKPHGVSKLEKGGKSIYVIKGLIVQVLGATIRISWNKATVKDRPSDERVRGQVL